jgi:hypothetical protein
MALPSRTVGVRTVVRDRGQVPQRQDGGGERRRGRALRHALWRGNQGGISGHFGDPSQHGRRRSPGGEGSRIEEDAMPLFRRNFGRGVPMGGQEGIHAMKIFGPFCPTTPKAASIHVERLVDVLRVQQEHGGGGRCGAIRRPLHDRSPCVPGPTFRARPRQLLPWPVGHDRPACVPAIVTGRLGSARRAHADGA